MADIHFWNGNKSAVRQTYELALVHRVLNVCGTDDAKRGVVEDRTDYPNAADEGAIFQKGIDVCVTVAGNPKFAEGTYLPVYDPLMNGLLGHRLLIIRQQDADAFAAIKQADQLQKKVMGIPETWADAPLFRNNGYAVLEKGQFDDVFNRLKNGECDYLSFGANETHAIFAEKARALGGLCIEPTLRLYYPFALVFYVHPDQPSLAVSLAKGLSILRRSGEYETLFADFFRLMFAEANLSGRHEIALDNPALPAELEGVMANVRSHITDR